MSDAWILVIVLYVLGGFLFAAMYTEDFQTVHETPQLIASSLFWPFIALALFAQLIAG